MSSLALTLDQRAEEWIEHLQICAKSQVADITPNECRQLAGVLTDLLLMVAEQEKALVAMEDGLTVNTSEAWNEY